MKRSSDSLEQKLKRTSKRKILSFNEYLEEVSKNLSLHLRDSFTYIKDCMDYFGTYTVERNGFPIRRFKIFDAIFDNGKDPLVGQETAQNNFYGFLDAKIRLGRTPRLFLLHGPNGSAKTTFFRTLMRGLEAYSDTDEGALYRFNWIFPSGVVSGKGIGFGKLQPHSSNLESFAHLDANSIDSILPDEFRDHPILLIPSEIRKELINEWISESGDDFILPSWLEKANLHPRNRKICDALLLSSQNGLMDIYRYIQIERFSLSRRYRRGLVTAEPKMATDASMRQITADKNLASLPPALQNLDLFRYTGDLVDANRGLIEFTDLFKKPVEAFKYLINTLEEGYLNLDMAILQFNLCFTGSVNDRHMMAFTETPDFASFEGRTEFSPMPYILEYKLEELIQKYALERENFGKAITPHTLETISVWAIMTRLVKPSLEDSDLNEILSELNVYEKAVLYGSGLAPKRYTSKISQKIKEIIPKLIYQSLSNVVYEGGLGASPRLVRSILLKAATRYDKPWLSTLNIFNELEKLEKEKSTHEFLNYPAQEGGFHNYKEIVKYTKEHWYSLISSDLWNATNLVNIEMISSLLEKYINTILHFINGEKIKDPITGEYSDASETVMTDFEQLLEIKDDPVEFRSSFISRIGAYKLDHPDTPVDYSKIFYDEILLIEEKSLNEKKAQLYSLLGSVMNYLADENNENVTDEIKTIFTNLKVLGYTKEIALEVIDYFLRREQEKSKSS